MPPLPGFAGSPARIKSTGMKARWRFCGGGRGKNGVPSVLSG